MESERLKRLPPYLFVEIDKAKSEVLRRGGEVLRREGKVLRRGKEARKKGKDLIDLGIGDPDQPTPPFIINQLCKAARDSANHHYALDYGMPILRKAITKWYKKKFNVDLDADREVLPLIGSKEGIAHLPLAILNRGDYSLVPDPCYPPYRSGSIFAGGKVHSMPLLAGNDFLPDLKRIPKGVLKKAKLIFVNYPNNPTSSVATDKFYRKLIDFALDNHLVIASDIAYSEIVYDRYKARSLLEFRNAKRVVIEFHSLSKTYNMTGWRVGWASGNKQLINLLSRVKSNIDSGIFQAIQIAAVTALESSNQQIRKMRQIYQERRDILVSGLKSLGWDFRIPRATFYLWTKVPRGYDSQGFTKFLLQKAGIVVTPGVGFGRYGEGYIRLALTVSKQRIREAVTRLRKL